VKSEDKPVASGEREAPDKLRSKFSGKRFVFTSAQNNTFVHPRFWKALLRFCEHKGARLVVGSFTYNKSGFQNLTKDGAAEEVWYDPKVVPYFVDEATEVLPDLVWCGELDILPTAVNPLSGFDNYTRSASSIIPHSKVQMKSVPTMKYEPTKFLYTTGACTLRNYIQRKAGQKAAFHHVFGALYVEIDDEGDWFARQLIADKNGVFYDLTEKFSADKVSTGHRVVAINWGDVHAECPDHQVAKGAWINQNCMLDVLEPRYQFVHDLTDFRPRNHHNISDPFFLATMVAEKSDSVERGLRHSAVFLMLVSRRNCQTVVVDSNHDQALERWLKDKHGQLDPVNAGYWHSLNAWVHQQIKEHRLYHVFEHAIRTLGCPQATRFLREDESFEICTGKDGSPGIECGLHGHRGPNGSRGSPNAFRVVGKRSNTGHTHIAGILDGVFTAGVSARLDLDYNKGPSAWSHSHIVTYKNSKRTIITMKGSKWRASQTAAS
jgi:hypothetical protein